jgi:hypothetical protein
MALLLCIERVAPLLDGCGASDLCCKCTVGREVLVEEAEELFKGPSGRRRSLGRSSTEVEDMMLSFSS